MADTSSVAQIQAFFQSTGIRFISQKEALDEVIRGILALGEPVNNKTIIIGLMSRLAEETDLDRVEAMRDLLQLVVGTPDDYGV